MAGRYAVLAGLALAFCVVYAAAAWPHLREPLPAATLLAWGALYTPLPAQQWPRLVTTWFVHVDPLHLAGNLAAWAAAGLPWPQRRLDGARPRLLLFVGCGLLASLASLLAAGGKPVVSAGPSGAIVGVLVVALVQRGGSVRTRLLWLLAITGLLLGGWLSGGDTAAHLGGAGGGLLCGLGLRWLAPAD